MIKDYSMHRKLVELRTSVNSLIKRVSALEEEIKRIQGVIMPIEVVGGPIGVKK